MRAIQISVRVAMQRFIIAASLSLTARVPLIAGHDVEAYKLATSLKAETDAVLSHGIEAYARNLTKIEDLKVRLNAAHEYAMCLPRNQNLAPQWELMVDPVLSKQLHMAD